MVLLHPPQFRSRRLVVTSGGDIRNFTSLELIDSTFAISPAVVQLGDDEPVRRPGPYRGLGVVNTGASLVGSLQALV